MKATKYLLAILDSACFEQSRHYTAVLARDRWVLRQRGGWPPYSQRRIRCSMRKAFTVAGRLGV